MKTKRYDRLVNQALALIIISLATISGVVRAEEKFPLPENLKDNVEFWTKIYTRYSTDQVIIHDAVHINIIYKVINLDDYFARDVSYRLKWKKVNQVKNEYKKILRRLAHMHSPIDTRLLNEKELYVYNLWKDVDEKDKFYRASRNIRGQKGLKDQFKRGLERSGRYMREMQKIFEEYGLPRELCYLPHVESSFNYKAYSKMGAAGMWQFTRSTGRLFLKINYSIDERFDPILCTEAAARLLKKNYEELGSWPLAITAYNHGLAGMKRAKRKLKTDDFGVIVAKYRSRSFGFASRNFYAEFLAAKEIAENSEKYFQDIVFEPPLEYREFELPNYVSLNALAKLFNIDKEELALYNPAFRQPILRSHRRIPRGYRLRLPNYDWLEPEKLYAALPTGERHQDQIKDKYYKVRRGDNLGDIARRAGVSVRAIMALNDIYNPNYIVEGQLLELPVQGKPAQFAQVASSPPLEVEEKETLGGGTMAEVRNVQEVQTAETPVAKADAIASSDPPVATMQQQQPADTIHAATIRQLTDFDMVYGPPVPGDSTDDLSLTSTASDKPLWSFEVQFEEPRSDWITVQPEETLGHYADWLNLPTQRLRMINGIPYGQGIQVGQKLRLLFTNVSRPDFHQKRLEYHRSIQEDFFTNFRVDSLKTYTIEYGDNIWDLCNNQFNLPFWLLARYNADSDLLRLYPGDAIKVPVVIPINQAELADNEAE